MVEKSAKLESRLKHARRRQPVAPEEEARWCYKAGMLHLEKYHLWKASRYFRETDRHLNEALRGASTAEGIAKIMRAKERVAKAIDDADPAKLHRESFSDFMLGSLGIVGPASAAFRAVQGAVVAAAAASDSNITAVLLGTMAIASEAYYQALVLTEARRVGRILRNNADRHEALTRLELKRGFDYIIKEKRTDPLARYEMPKTAADDSIDMVG